jgi:hypothetical protein
MRTQVLTWTFPLVAVFLFGGSAKAQETPPDPVFDDVTWYVCKTDMVKYKQGMEEKESKWQCVNDAGQAEIPTKVVGKGNGKLEVPILPDLRGSLYLYPVMSDAQAKHFKEKMYELQCDRKLGRLDGGIQANGVELYMFAPPHMDQGNGATWADEQFATKKQVVLPQASVYGAASRRGGGPKELNCQFYSKTTNARFGLFHATIP